MTEEYHLPRVLRDVVISYLPDHELLSWIDENDLEWGELSRNPSAIQFLEMNIDKINWSGLSCNPAAIHLLEANQDKISWWNLSGNFAAIHLLESNQDKINWNLLSRLPNAEHLIKNNLDKTPLDGLMRNPTCFHYCVDDPSEWFDEESGMREEIWMLYRNSSDAVFNMLYEHDKHLSDAMYSNPLAVQYIDDYANIDWYYLSKNPAAIDILEANQDKIEWYKLCVNPAAMKLLEANQDKIDWFKLSANPGIFKRVPKSEIDALL